MRRRVSLPVFMVVSLLVAALLSAGFFAFYNKSQLNVIKSFEKCSQKYPVMESYPAQCSTPGGKHFVQPQSK